MTRWELLTRRAAKTVVQTFKVDDFIIYHYRDGTSCKICAVFDSINYEANTGGEVMIDTVQHFILIEKYMLTRKPLRGDLITRRNITYEIVEIEEDGHASYRIRLHETDTTNAPRHFEII